MSVCVVGGGRGDHNEHGQGRRGRYIEAGGGGGGAVCVGGGGRGDHNEHGQGRRGRYIGLKNATAVKETCLFHVVSLMPVPL